MTTQEKRFCRRELINDALLRYAEFNRTPTLSWIIFSVRYMETYRYGQELKVYSK